MCISELVWWQEEKLQYYIFLTHEGSLNSTPQWMMITCHEATFSDMKIQNELWSLSAAAKWQFILPYTSPTRLADFPSTSFEGIVHFNCNGTRLTLIAFTGWRLPDSEQTWKNEIKKNLQTVVVVETDKYNFLSKWRHWQNA